jgi:hypothetical protein
MAKLSWRLVVNIDLWLAVAALASLPIGKRLENHTGLAIIQPLTL